MCLPRFDAIINLWFDASPQWCLPAMFILSISLPRQPSLVGWGAQHTPSKEAGAGSLLCRVFPSVRSSMVWTVLLGLHGYPAVNLKAMSWQPNLVAMGNCQTVTRGKDSKQLIALLLETQRGYWSFQWWETPQSRAQLKPQSCGDSCCFFRFLKWVTPQKHAKLQIFDRENPCLWGPPISGNAYFVLITHLMTPWQLLPFTLNFPGLHTKREVATLCRLQRRLKPFSAQVAKLWEKITNVGNWCPTPERRRLGPKIWKDEPRDASGNWASFTPLK